MSILQALSWAYIGFLLVWATSPAPSCKEYLSVRDIILEDRKRNP